MKGLRLEKGVTFSTGLQVSLLVISMRPLAARVAGWVGGRHVV